MPSHKSTGLLDQKLTVNLTPEETCHAMQTALLRWFGSVKNGRKESVKQNSWIDGLLVHFYGVIGEIAVGKGLGIYVPCHVDQFKGMASDIPPNIEVRYSHGNELIIREDDPDDRHYYLVTGTPPDLTVHGWIKGSEGKNEWWLEDRGKLGKPAYFVPIDALNQIESETA